MTYVVRCDYGDSKTCQYNQHGRLLVKSSTKGCASCSTKATSSKKGLLKYTTCPSQVQGASYTSAQLEINPTTSPARASITCFYGSPFGGVSCEYEMAGGGIVFDQAEGKCTPIKQDVAPYIVSSVAQ